MSIEIRTYHPRDESSWLRCRALSFLGTCYYDAVVTSRPTTPAVQLVAARDGTVVGILDIEVEGELATIDTVATHPDHTRLGIASELLERARAVLPDGVTTLDAWTREDEPVLAWYRARGFVESEHYLHVYKGFDDPGTGWESPAGLSTPLIAFCHAGLEHETDLRVRYSRVYVCRRFSQAVARR